MSNVISLVRASENPQHWEAQDCLKEVQQAIEQGFKPNKFIVLAINDAGEDGDLRYWNAGCSEYDIIAVLALFQTLVLKDMTCY